MIMWDEHGQKKAEMNYKGLNIEGLMKTWDEDGTKTESNYENGEPNGTTKIWDKAGVLKCEIVFVHGIEKSRKNY